ncbi:hypothetical protein LSAT2_012326 [Lamellibrachia satsuma]|nr:hypothetical protein LSAT2_012326 [Lamellibrachia satsuma]
MTEKLREEFWKRDPNKDVIETIMERNPDKDVIETIMELTFYDGKPSSTWICRRVGGLPSLLREHSEKRVRLKSEDDISVYIVKKKPTLVWSQLRSTSLRWQDRREKHILHKGNGNCSNVAVTTLGALALVKGAVGFGVATKHGMQLLAIYSGAISVVLIGEAIAIAISFSHRANIDNNLETLLTLTIKDAYEGATINKNKRIIESHEPFSIAWDITMATYECCGVHSHRDFALMATRWNRGLLFRGAIIRAHVPLICCKMVEPKYYPYEMGKVAFASLGKCMKHGNVLHINTKPCLQSVRSMVRGYTTIHIVVIVINTVVDLFCVFAALFLFFTIRRRFLRRKAYRAQKKKVFTMLTDLSTSMLFGDNMPMDNMVTLDKGASSTDTNKSEITSANDRSLSIE